MSLVFGVRGVFFKCLVMSEFKTDQDFKLQIFDCCIFDSKNTKEVLESPSSGTHQALKITQNRLKRKKKGRYGAGEREREREV